MTMWSKGYRTLWLEVYQVSYHPASFSNHRHCGIGDKMFKIACHMISQDYMIKASCNIIGRSPWGYVTILVGREVIPPPPFLKSKMSPPFRGLQGKQKCWMFLLTDLYIISTHKVSEFWKNIYKSGEMQTRYNAFKCFLINFMKSSCQLEKGI